MRIRTVMMGLTGVLTVVAATALLAQPPAPPAEGAGRGWVPPAERMKQQMGLSDQQAVDLEKLMREERKRSIRHQADLRVAQMELDELLGAATPDDKLVAAKVKQIADLQSAGIRARLDERVAARKMLTAEQYQKFQRFGPRAAMRARAMRDGGWGGGRHWRSDDGRARGPGGPRGPALVPPEVPRQPSESGDAPPQHIR